MKIAVVGPAYPLRGGIAHYTTLLASHLAAEHETRLYSFERQYPAWLFPGQSQTDPSSAPLAAVDTRCWLTPWWPLSWRRVVNDWKIWQPQRMVMQWWVPFMAPMTAWLMSQARRLGIHSTLICHNVLPHEQSRVDRTVVRWALHGADRLVVHTTAQQTLAQQLLPEHAMSVVPLPSYAAFRSEVWTRDRARAELKLTRPTLLFFGFVRPYKGLLDLIEALPTVLAQVDVDLLVVGEIWGAAAPYHKLVQELNLSHRVQFISRYVSNEEAALYFAAADLVVLPYREATGSAVLQLAFGLGVPIVATRTGGMDEVVEDEVTGFLVEPGNVDGLARAIARFFQEEQASSFRAAIVRAQVRFGWNCLVDVIIDES